jgi:dolichol kinase
MYFSLKSDIINNFIGLGAMFFVFVNVLVLLMLMIQDKDIRVYLLPLFTYTLVLPIVLIIIAIIFSAVVLKLYNYITKDKDIIKLNERIEERIKGRSRLRVDIYRKLSHVIIFIGVLVLWYISYSMTKAYNEENDIKEEIKHDPDNTNMLYSYLRLLTKPNSIANVMLSMQWLYYVIFFVFYILCLVMIANEFTRKSKHLAFPLNSLPNLIISEQEKRSYGTYLYFCIGNMFAAFICPPMVFFAILGMSSIGDLMTSQIGIRYGKHHISWNRDKTWEGSLAGVITSFIICFIFIGPLYSVILTVVFLIVDIITNKPFKSTDNLLIPIGTAITFVLVRFYTDIDYFSILLELFMR